MSNNNNNKSCVCSGIRSCLLCQPNKVIKQKSDEKYIDYYFCFDCGHKAFVKQFRDHKNHTKCEPMVEFEDYFCIDGIVIKLDVIDVNQELDLITKIDSIQWIDSQSGRQKQDFGPKVNFKKQKLNFNEFYGLPDFDVQLLKDIKQHLRQGTDQSDSHSDGLLNDFIAVEVCHLDYNSLRGSSIDAHFDDFWVWGQRLVTVNLLSSTVLNLFLPPLQQQQPLPEGRAEPRIRIVLPQRSVVILSSESRFKYQHSIDSKDINGRRVAITYRELSEEFLPGGHSYEKWGKHIIERSLNSL